MNAIAVNFAQFVQINHSKIITTSEFIATAFKKQHKDVLRNIDNLLSGIPADFATANFRETEVLRDNLLTGGKTKSRAYELTKDGFMLLVMGFTGKAALQIKITYIEAFNAMAKRLQQLEHPVNSTPSSTTDRAPLRDAINLLVYRQKWDYGTAYRLVHQRFNVEHVDELNTEQIGQAVEYVHRILCGEVLDAPKQAQLPAVSDGSVVLSPNDVHRLKIIFNYLPYMMAYYHCTAPAVAHLNDHIIHRTSDRFGDTMMSAGLLAKSLNMPMLSGRDVMHELYS